MKALNNAKRVMDYIQKECDNTQSCEGCVFQAKGKICMAYQLKTSLLDIERYLKYVSSVFEED